MLVEFDDSLRTGVESIDEQHKMLLDMLNELYEKMNLGAASQAVCDALQGMKAYAAFHFEDEEKLLQQHDYPELEAHVEAHREFVRRLQGLEDVVSQDSLTGALEVLHFLKQWLVQHIKGMDMEFVPYVTQS